MSEVNNSRGRWEFDENGNVRFVPGSGQSDSGASVSDFSQQTGQDGTYHYKYQGGRPVDNGNWNAKKPGKSQDTGWHWIFIILGFMVAPPVGIVALILHLTGKWPTGKQLQRGAQKVESAAQRAVNQAKQSQQQQWQQTQRTGTQPPQSPQHKTAATAKREKASQKQIIREEDRARGLGHVGLFRGIGAAMAGIFGFTYVMEMIDQIGMLLDGYWSVSWMLSETTPLLALTLIGVALICFAGSRDRKSKRFRRYLSAIGKKRRIPIEPLASAMGLSEKKVNRDLQEMLERGYLEDGYLDMARKMLVIGEMEFEIQPEPVPETEAQPENLSTAAATIRHIQEVNEAIANPELSEKIYRIEELTAKIFRLLEERPEKSGELRSFMNYYLPQTLKILENYAQLEAQGVEGGNIAEAKQKIEITMDKVVDGYETQLDKLFADDVLDISADLKVMESMLEKDGLTADNELKF